MMASVSLTINGKAVKANVDSRTLLVEFLREHQRLTGTHVGCDTSQCGACVVHIDGKAVKSCTTLAVQCDGAHVTTIEGLAHGEHLHPMQAAFREHHGSRRSRAWRMASICIRCRRRSASIMACNAASARPE
jgi:carbon-monoxide dehydrogenase small subunit